MSVLALMVALAAAPDPSIRELSKEVSQIARGFSGEFGLYVEDVDSGATLSHHADAPMYLASGIKIVVMIALYQAMAAGELSLEETIDYRAVDLRDGTPILGFARPGTPITLGALLEVMIQSSDNTATDLLIRRVGLEAVNTALAKEGIEGFGPITTLIEVRRLVYEKLDPRGRELEPKDIFRLAMARPANARMSALASMLGQPEGRWSVDDYSSAYDSYYSEGWNSASMSKMGELLRKLVRQEVVSPEASIRMIQIMSGTRTGTHRFKAGLPDDVVLAHKTGTQQRRTCDFGVMFLPPNNRPVIVAASVSGGSRREAERVLARVARATYRAMTAKGDGPRAEAAVHRRRGGRGRGRR